MEIIETASPPRILVVDDDPALVRMIRLTLESDGFDVATAQDGVTGLEKYEGASFDAVVLDLQMPRMDGRTFYRELRSRGVNTPVLILSAYEAESARSELRANAAISKPFDPDLLIEAVRQLIENPDKPEMGR